MAAAMFAPAAPALAECPSAPLPTATTNNCSAIVVTWTAAPDANGYEITRAGGSGTVVLAEDWPTLSFTDSSAVPGINYNYRLRARTNPGFGCLSGIGSPGPFSNAGVRPHTPAAPIVSIGSTVCVAEFAVTAPAGSTQVAMYRSTTNDFGTATHVTTFTAVPATMVTYPDFPPAAAPGTIFYYWFRSLNVCGLGTTSPAVPLVMSAAIPSTPPVLTANPAASCFEFSFGWAPVPWATQYVINVTSTSGYTNIHTVNGTSFTDNFSSSEVRTYTVFAKNGCGTGPSASIIGSVGLPPSTAVVAPPESTVAFVGDTVTFTPTLDGSLTPPIVYTWTLDGNPIPSDPRITGQGGVALTITGVRAQDIGSYRLHISTPCGDAETSPAVLAVKATCTADIDESGSVSADDIFAFLDRWFAQQGMPCP